jgi:hypothetical protein
MIIKKCENGNFIDITNGVHEDNQMFGYIFGETDYIFESTELRYSGTHVSNGFLFFEHFKEDSNLIFYGYCILFLS